MLTLMRNLLRTKLAGLLFVILIIAMAAWGVTDVFSGSLGSNLLGAGKRVLPEARFDAEVERILSTQTDDKGRSLTKEQALENGLIDQIFQQEQIDLTLRAYADATGITATPNAVRGDLTETPAFLDVSGKFDPALYRSLLEQNRLTPAVYQDNIEGALTISRLQRIPLAALQAPTTLARIEAAYSSEQRSAEWFTIRQDALPPIGDPTEEDLQALFTEAGANLREPERRRVSMIRLSPDDFLSQAEVTDDDITAFYDAYKGERYTAEGTRVFTEFNFNDEGFARSALGRIAGGASAEQLEGLQSTSRREGTKDLIANTRLADQAFGGAAQPGAIFGPQQTGELWTIIRVEEIIPGEVTPLEDVYDAIQAEIARSHAVGVYYEALPRFDDLLGSGATLEDLATAMGTPLLSFEAVDASGFNATGTRYRTLVLAEGLLPSIFARPEGGVTERFEDDEVTWIGRVDAIVPERAPSFEEVRADLDTAWRLREASTQMQTTAGDIEAQLKAGEISMADAAASFGTSVQSNPAPMTRVNFQGNLPGRLFSSIFDARNVGEILSSPTQAGEFIVLKVTAIERPSAEDVTALATLTVSRTQSAVAQDLFQAYFGEVQKTVKLKVNDSALASYKARIVPSQ